MPSDSDLASGFYLMGPVKTRRAFAALAIALSVSATAWAPRNLAVAPVADRLSNGENLKIVVYGTSLSAKGAWVNQVQEDLQTRFPGTCELINSSECGKNSDWGLANLDKRVLRLEPDVVVFEFAINDAVARFHCPVERAESNLRKMVDQVLEQNPRTQILVQTTNPVFDRPASNSGYRPRLPDYYQMVRKVARERRLILVDQEQTWNAVLSQGKRQFRRLVPDGLHPNKQGDIEVVTPVVLAAFGAL